jgi:hypothetical protein
LTAGFFFLSIVVSSATSSLTLSEGSAVSPSTFRIVAATMFFSAALCFLAHWDVNRGRRIRVYDVEEDDGADL